MGNKIKKNIVESFLSESFSEVMEGVMAGGISIGETTEIAEPAIVFKAFGEVSFRGGITEVNKEKGFKEALRIIALSAYSVIAIFRATKFIDKGKINAFKEDFKGVVRGDHTGDGEVGKGVWGGFSHTKASVEKIFEDFNILKIYEKMGYMGLINVGIKAKIVA